MGHFPADETWNEKGLECPGCGHIHEDNGEGYLYPQGNSIEDQIDNFECENCGLVFSGSVELTPHWTATHPQKCSVKGYHVVHARKEVKGCLYCDVVLTCDCPNWDYETAKAENKSSFSSGPYVPMADRNGHCKHHIDKVARNE